jgi:BlaI family transcriptional regulator, penicillinase repressor
MPRKSPETELTRRERQIMDILFAAGSATGQEVQARLPDSPSYSTVRTLLRILEDKGYVKHREEGLRYLYVPAVAIETARKSALQRVLRTFFDGSAQQAVAALLDPKSFSLSREELDELTELVERAKRQADK